MRETGVLPENYVIGEISLKLVAQHFLFALELIDARIAGEQTGRDSAERRIDTTVPT